MKLQKAFLLVLGFVIVISLGSIISSGGQKAEVVSAAEGPRVESFTLINADTDREIGTLTNGQVIDSSLNVSIRANTNPATTGSVKFGLDANSNYRIENTAPYSLCADKNATDYYVCDLAEGTHTLTATAYTLSRAKGIAGSPTTITFSRGAATTPQTPTTPTTPSTATTPQTTQTPTTPTTNPASGLRIDSFSLIDASTDRVIGDLENGQTIDIGRYPSISVRANASGNPGSVRFYVNQAVGKTENTAPFSINADINGTDYVAWDYPTGEVTITAIPAKLARFRGEQGTPLSIIVNIGGSAPSSDEEAGSTPPPRALEPGTNGVATTSPTEGATHQIGDTVPMTCEITTAPGYSVWKLVYAWYQYIPGGTTVAGDFTTINNPGYTSGSYTQNVQIPSDGIENGPFTFLCVAYYYDGASSWDTMMSSMSTVNLGSVSPATSIKIDSPLPGENILSNGDFLFTVSGDPSDAGIQEVKFYYDDNLAITNDLILLGTDTQAPFSIHSSLSGNRGAACAGLRAVATLSGGGEIQSTKTRIVITDAPATPTANAFNCSEENTTFSIIDPDYSSPAFTQGQPMEVKVEYDANIDGATPDYVLYRVLGGNVAENNGIWQVNFEGKATSAPFDITIPNAPVPGDYGHSYFTNPVFAYIYYSDGRVITTSVPVRIEPSVNVPSISSLQLINSTGTVIQTLTGGETINIGNQNGGLGVNLSIKANASADAQSVKFTLQKPNSTSFVQTENTEPYSLFGDTGATSYVPWQDLQLGAYTLTVTPYSLDSLAGLQGVPSVIQFQVVNSDDSTPPINPTGTSITYRSGGQIKLSWVNSTSPDVSYYKVYRDGVYLGFPVSHPTNTFTDTVGLNATSSYTYKVTAVDTSGNEAVLPVTGTSTTALSTNYISSDQVQVAVTSAIIKTSPDSTGSAGTQPSGSIGVITNGPVWVTGNNQYWFVNFNTGVDGWVKETDITDYVIPTDTQAPSSPATLAVTTTTSNSISIDWANSTDLGGGTVAGYKVFRSATQTGTYAQVGTAATSDYTDMGLGATTTYWYKVTAYDNATPANESAQSSAISGTTLVGSSDSIAPTVPAGLMEVAKSAVSVTADWTASTDNVGVVRYELQAYTGWNGVGTLINTFNVTPPQTAETVTGFTANTSYSLKVRACDLVNNCSAWSSWLNTTTNTATIATLSSDSAVKATAVAQSSPARITLSWPNTGTVSIYRKLASDTAFPTTALGTSSTGTYIDSTAVVGTAYEYKLSIGTSAYGYVSSGINVPLSNYKGKIVLLVASNLSANTSIQTALDQYKNDLKGEGWYPITHSVATTDSADSVRNLVIADYNADPTNVKAVSIIGRVPVKMTGNITPDGHSPSRPFPADAFYGDVDGTWGTVTTLPDNIELQVGRIDLSGMSSLGTEVNLTLNYFDKLHKFRTAQFVPNNRGILLDNLTWTNAPLAQSGWRSIVPLVGSGSQNFVQTHINTYEYESHISDNTWLWGFGAGAGIGDITVGGTGFAQGPDTIDYATKNIGVVFNMMFGSYFGDWSKNNSLARAPLGQGAGLTNVWAARPNYLFHRMGMGENIGESIRRSMNNTISGAPGYNEYKTICGCNSEWGGGEPGAHMALMGDVAVRMNYFAPPTNFVVTNSSGTAQFNWTPSTASGINGYYIYKINSDGTMTAVNGGALVTGSSYSSPTIPYATGTEWIIRAEKSVTTASGTYKNLSVGAYANTGAPIVIPPSTTFSPGNTVEVIQ